MTPGRGIDVPFSLAGLPSLARSVRGLWERVEVPDTHLLPYRLVCFLQCQFAGAIGYGTGVLIGPRSVATAAHCVYGEAGPIQSMRITPGAYLNTDLELCCPDGYAEVGFSDCHLPPGWADVSAGDDFSSIDYAVIVLPDDQPALGSKQGWMALDPLGPDKDDWLGRVTLQTAGYPSVGFDPGSQWQDQGEATSVTTERLDYRLATSKGQSGSPIYVTFAVDSDGQPKTWLVAIHSFGNGRQSGVRIGPDVYKQIMAWRS
jgi:glutamyl endopeptidase